MKLILKILNIFFVVLGVIFFGLILVGVYIFKTDALGLNAFVSPTQTIGDGIINSTEPVEDKHPALNESQEKMLETVGVDPATLPTEVTPEQESCFEEAIGIERVNEIKAGDVPTVTDYFKAKDCI
tara:strand:+ start:851 stop:1228 length:378 start_codon:yes stop_codon:yes gene_type:complete